MNYYNIILLTIISPAIESSRMLDTWQETQGILTDVQSVNGKTTANVDGNKIIVDDLSESDLKEIVGYKVSIIRTESGHRWFAEVDQK